MVSNVLRKSKRKARTFLREMRDLGLCGALALSIDRLSWKWNPKKGSLGVRKVVSRHFKHPIYYRRHTSDSWAIEMVLTDKEYEQVSLPKAPKVIVDCGANIGCASLYLLAKYPEARVIAIEPDGENFKICQRNLEPFGSRATLMKAAIWPEDTGLEVVRGEFRGGWEWAHQVRPVEEGGSAEIQGISMESLLAGLPEGRIDLLKIDIEGAETSLFARGCDEWLSRVDNICIELHGAEAEAAFFKSLANFTFERDAAGELTVCKSIRPRAASTHAVA